MCDRGAISTEIFQVAMQLSLDWGKDWLQPINVRIREKYPRLTEEQAQELNRMCKEIQRFCWDDLCYKELDGIVTTDQMRKIMQEKYPILDEKNPSRLISQGMYYVRK